MKYELLHPTCAHLSTEDGGKGSGRGLAGIIFRNGEDTALVLRIKPNNIEKASVHISYYY